MRKHIAVILTVGLLVAADKPKEEAKDGKLILGKWKLVSSRRSGKDADVKDWQATFAADKITFVSPTGKEAEQAYQLDPTKKPKTIDLQIPASGEWGLGIYSLEGDTLKLCTAKPGADRPTDFASTAESGWTLTVCERVKPK